MPDLDPADTEEAAVAEARMSFGEHLDELRRRILNALYGAVFGVGFCIYFMYDIFAIIARPYRLAARVHHVPDIFNTLKPQEGFMTFITLAIEAGLILTSPWIIYQLWQFVAAGLYPRERRIVYRYVGPSSLLFLLGVAFFYFVVLPMTLTFFLGFTANTAGPPPQPTWLERHLYGIHEPIGGSATAPAATAAATGPATSQPQPITMPVLTADPSDLPEGTAALYFHEPEARVKVKIGKDIYTMLVAQENSLFTNNWRADDYLSFVAFSSLVFGVAFEMPMVILILAQTGIVGTQTFRNVRKYAYFGILIAAVAAAPSGDLMTLMFLFLPLIGLYEIGIIIAALVVREPRDASREPQEPEETT
jgi:sec-independent protein translocase protein TatC